MYARTPGGGVTYSRCVYRIIYYTDEEREEAWTTLTVVISFLILPFTKRHAIYITTVSLNIRTIVFVSSFDDNVSYTFSSVGTAESPRRMYNATRAISLRVRGLVAVSWNPKCHSAANHHGLATQRRLRRPVYYTRVCVSCISQFRRYSVRGRSFNRRNAVKVKVPT